MTAPSSPLERPERPRPAPGARPRRRAEILGAAAALFAREGYHSASMREVAAACGILAGSLYHHFPSKEAIAVELIEDYHADLDRAVREPAPPGPDPVAALRAFARDIAQVSSRHRAALQITLFDAPASASTALKTAVHDEPASVERHWGTLISAAAAAGAIGAGIDRQILRHVLHCTTRQVGSVVRERGGPRAAADCTTAILFDGLASVLGPGDCPVGAAALVLGYFGRENAGQCGSCFNGTAAMAGVAAALARGEAGEADLQRLERWRVVLPGRGACGTLDGAVNVAASLLREFPGEVRAHRNRACPLCAETDFRATASPFALSPESITPRPATHAEAAL